MEINISKKLLKNLSFMETKVNLCINNFINKAVNEELGSKELAVILFAFISSLTAKIILTITYDDLKERINLVEQIKNIIIEDIKNHTNNAKSH